MANVGTFQNSVISKLLIHPFVWRVTGFGSSIVGFSCYAFSPSFAYFFGKWSTLKIVVYSVVSSLLCMSTLFVKRCSVGHGKCLLLKAQVSFLVLALTSLWSFWEDCHEVQGKVKKGHGKLMNLTSSGAFSLMAMSLSRQLQLGFEVGATNFLVGCFLVTIMKMNLKLAPIAALFCYLLVNIRSISDFLHEKRARDATATQHADAVNVQDREANSIIVSARDTHEASSQDPESCSDDVFKHHGDDTVVSGEIFTKKESAESEGEESFRSDNRNEANFQDLEVNSNVVACETNEGSLQDLEANHNVLACDTHKEKVINGIQIPLRVLKKCGNDVRDFFSGMGLLDNRNEAKFQDLEANSNVVACDTNEGSLQDVEANHNVHARNTHIEKVIKQIPLRVLKKCGNDVLKKCGNDVLKKCGNDVRSFFSPKGLLGKHMTHTE